MFSFSWWEEYKVEHKSPVSFGLDRGLETPTSVLTVHYVNHWTIIYLGSGIWYKMRLKKMSRSWIAKVTFALQPKDPPSLVPQFRGVSTECESSCFIFTLYVWPVPHLAVATLVIALCLQSVFLLDQQRISVLYMTSGKTKRKITKLQPLLKHVVRMSPTSSGRIFIDSVHWWPAMSLMPCALNTGAKEVNPVS